MNRLLKSMCVIDFFLLTRVFVPLSHWIDWRFHRSPYQQAKAVIWAAQAVNIAGVCTASLHAWWIMPFMALVAVFLHFTIFRDYRRKLDACQRQFERRPDILCFEQYFFMMVLVPPLRLFQLVFGLLIMLPLLLVDTKLHDGAWGALMNCWVFFIGVMLYIAGCPPPTRKRREKKVWAFLPGLPQGA